MFLSNANNVGQSIQILQNKQCNSCPVARTFFYLLQPCFKKKTKKAENFLEWKVMYLLTFFITQNLIRVIPLGRDFIWEHFIQKENISEIFQHLQLGTCFALLLLRFTTLSAGRKYYILDLRDKEGSLSTLLSLSCSSSPNTCPVSNGKDSTHLS